MLMGSFLSYYRPKFVAGKYGKVKRVIWEKFPAEFGLDMYTGVQSVYIDMKKKIPSSLHLYIYIFYEGSNAQTKPEKQHQDEEKQQHNGKHKYVRVFR